MRTGGATAFASILAALVPLFAIADQEQLLTRLRLQLETTQSAPPGARVYINRSGDIDSMVGMKGSEVVSALGRPGTCVSDADVECLRGPLLYFFFPKDRPTGWLLVVDLSPQGLITSVAWEEQR